MAAAWFSLAVLVMLVGIVGVVVPFLPGLPLVLAGIYLYAVATGLGAGIGLGHVVLYTLVGGAAIVLGMLANLLGARAAGGSRAGVLGAALDPDLGPASRVIRVRLRWTGARLGVRKMRQKHTVISAGHEPQVTAPGPTCSRIQIGSTS